MYKCIYLIDIKKKAFACDANLKFKICCCCPVVLVVQVKEINALEHGLTFKENQITFFFFNNSNLFLDFKYFFRSAS